ncbi:MAG: serine/threonine-protein kinase [Myxococcota bacterium]
MSDTPSMGPYKLLESIGKGGQGSVWLARDARTGNTVALKVLRPDARGETEVARFRREAAILASLTDPGLPACLHLLEQPEGQPVALAMEYIKGIPLARLRRQRRLLPREVRAVGGELSRIVAVLHRLGLVHRDLKASNILLRQGWETGTAGSIVVVDLGIAKGTARHATSHTSPGFIVGSTAYMAPEYFLGAAETAEASMRADVFAIGVLLWLLLFEQHPTGLPVRCAVLDLMEAYADGTFAQPDADLVAALERSVPGIADVARRCCSYEPSQRFANAMQVHDALTALVPAAGQTKLCIEPAPMSYNVAIYPRPAAQEAGAAQGFPEALTIDLDAEAPTRTREPPPPEPTLDEPASETIAALREQFSHILEEDQALVPSLVRGGRVEPAHVEPLPAGPASSAPPSSAPVSSGGPPPPSSQGAMPMTAGATSGATSGATQRRRPWLAVGGMLVGIAVVAVVVLLTIWLGPLAYRWAVRQTQWMHDVQPSTSVSSR